MAWRQLAEGNRKRHQGQLPGRPLLALVPQLHLVRYDISFPSFFGVSIISLYRIFYGILGMERIGRPITRRIRPIGVVRHSRRRSSLAARLASGPSLSTGNLSNLDSRSMMVGGNCHNWGFSVAPTWYLARGLAPLPWLSVCGVPPPSSSLLFFLILLIPSFPSQFAFSLTAASPLPLAASIRGVVG